MNIFGVGLPEMALILVLALLVFGPKKLPEIGRSLAQALGSFKKAQQEFETEFRKEAEQIQKSMNQPMKASIERPEPKALSARSEEGNHSEESNHSEEENHQEKSDDSQNGVLKAEATEEEVEKNSSQAEEIPT